ncbi:MAG: hypothetical protein SCH71_00655 [Desulfobulbaceae bacterium]|nr:hypothetical protein [Desulfobulbaceae bacterium]
MTTKTGKKINAWDRIMMAITFAEADESKTVRELHGAEETGKYSAANRKNEFENGNDRVLSTCAEIR